MVLERDLQQALRGQHVLDFAGADAEGQRAKRAVRGGMAVAAHDGQAGLRDAQLGADDVHDALVAAGHIEQRNAVSRAIPRQRLDLQAGILVEHGKLAVLRGYGMVHDRKGQVGAADFATGGLQAGKGLRRGDLMNQVAVNIDKGGLAGDFTHQVRLPNLVVHGFRYHST